MEERSLLIKKYIFPALIILSGLMLLNTAFFSGTGSTSQSGTFTLGAFVVLLMGVVTVLYIKEIITKKDKIDYKALSRKYCVVQKKNGVILETTDLNKAQKALQSSGSSDNPQMIATFDGYNKFIHPDTILKEVPKTWNNVITSYLFSFNSS